MDYRIKEIYSVFTPEKPFDTDRGLDDCCCEIPVFASSTSSDEWKNDTTLAFYKKAVTSDSCTFEMTKCGTAGTLINYGTDAVFPNDSLGIGFMYDWNEVLSNYGVGRYTITLQYTKAGVIYSRVWGVYDLREWSMSVVQPYVRMRTLFRSYNQKKDIDFTGSNCFDTLRVSGLFGKRDPQTETDQLITKGYISEKVTRKNDNQYTLETNLLSPCITPFLLDLHMIDEDECFITEHWKYNHTYTYIDYPVVFRELSSIEYYGKNRGANMVLVFGDRKLNDNSYYNGI
jgi:hypothetical protein